MEHMINRCTGLHERILAGFAAGAAAINHVDAISVHVLEKALFGLGTAPHGQRGALRSLETSHAGQRHVIF